MPSNEIDPYRPLLDSGLIRRFYLDEMPALSGAPLGLSILYLIRETESLAAAAATARELIVRAKAEIEDESLRDDLVELIETVIMYKLPRLNREEIQSMLQVHDIRESRVYQEAREEGIEEGKQKGKAEGKEEGLALAIARMGANKMAIEQIAAILELDVERVRHVLATAGQN